MLNRWIAIGGVVWLAAIVGCSDDNEGGGDSSGGKGGNTGGTAGSGGTAASGGTINPGVGGASTGGSSGSSGSSATGGTSTGGSSTGGGANACQVGPDTSGCVGEQYTGETTPLDIYIMFDQSCSMSCPTDRGGTGLCCVNEQVPRRINDVRAAVTQFLNDPQSAGIGVGIGYFGYMNAGQTSCDPARYSDPAVGMGVLPGHAQAIINSLDSVQPTGETPTGAAIRGACTYAAQWKGANPSHAVVVLLVTDGVPEAPVTSQNGGCTPTIADAAQAATTCFESQFRLPVYVLGVGQALDNLNQIAVAGGTNQAYIVSGGDVVGQVLQALNTIRSEAQIPCELSLPAQDPSLPPIDYQEVNVAYCDSAGQNSTFYYVATGGECDPQQGGWYYDDPANPQQIRLCEASCNRVGAPGGSLLLSVGCTTVLPPPR